MKCTILVANWILIKVHIACQVIGHPRRCHVHTHRANTSIHYQDRSPKAQPMNWKFTTMIDFQVFNCSVLVLCTHILPIYSVLMGCKFWSIPLIQIPHPKHEGSRVLWIWNNKNKMHMCKQSNNLWLASMVSLKWSWHQESEWKQRQEGGHVRVAINTWNSTTTGLSI